MLRIHTQTNAAAAKAYFDPKTHDYYVGGGHEAPAEWGGRAARMLGLEPGSPVDQSDFERLIDNLHPGTGERLTAAHRAFRRVGSDFTFSMPKSASLASLLDERISPAFLESVRFGMAEIEKDVAARVRVSGADEDRTVGNAAWALFPHSTSRPVDGIPDIHRHVHAFLLNAVHDPVEQKWKAAQLGVVKERAGYYEALVLSDFAHRLREFGYGIRRKGRYFELETVSDATVAKFSNRTRVIEEEAKARGVTDPVQKAELGGKTRERKVHTHTFDELKELWLARLTPQERTQLAERSGQVRAFPTPEQSARHALEHAFHFEAVRPVKAVWECALRHAFGASTLAALQGAANRVGLITRGERATTRELLALESRVLDWAGTGKGTCRPLCKGTDRFAGFRGEKLLGPELNAGQRAVVRHIWENRDRVALVRGPAGTGKTTALSVAVEGIRAAGHRFQALALSHTATDELTHGVDPHARTLASFLASKAAQEAVAGGVVLLDEASQVGLEDFARLVNVLDQRGCRLITAGDTKQHSSVAAGAPYKLLTEHAGLKPAVLTEIVRQTDPMYKAACARLAEHDVEGGLKLLDTMGAIREAADPYRTEALVIDYREALRDGKSVLVVTPTHAEAGNVTGALRAALKDDGVLTGEEHTFARLVNLNWTPAELKEARSNPDSTPAHAIRDGHLTLARYGAYRQEQIALMVGDQIRATAGFTDTRGNRINNGSRFVVAGFTPAGIAVTSPTGVARVLPGDAEHLAHDYCQTSYSSQSRTVDTVLISESSRSFAAADRAQIYVSASRARSAIKIYTDDTQGLREAVSRGRNKPNPSEVLGPAIVVTESPLQRRARVLRRFRALAPRTGHESKHATPHKEKGYGYGR